MKTDNALQKIGTETRENLLKKNYYQSDEFGEPYSAQHKDAVSDGDPQGKNQKNPGGAVDFKQPDPWNPNRKNYMFSSFSTVSGEGDTQIGGQYDVEARSQMHGRNLYHEEFEYGDGNIDLSTNDIVGQYFIRDNF